MSVIVLNVCINNFYDSVEGKVRKGKVMSSGQEFNPSVWTGEEFGLSSIVLRVKFFFFFFYVTTVMVGHSSYLRFTTVLFLTKLITVVSEIKVPKGTSQFFSSGPGLLYTTVIARGKSLRVKIFIADSMNCTIVL